MKLRAVGVKRTNPGETDMKLFKLVKNFRNDEEGAVTVDWVVLTAAVVGLGVAALAAVKSGTGALSTKINNNLASQTISSTF
jgi:Flp pilus assembly pilin Flp